MTLPSFKRIRVSRYESKWSRTDAGIEIREFFLSIVTSYLQNIFRYQIFVTLYLLEVLYSSWILVHWSTFQPTNFIPAILHPHTEFTTIHKTDWETIVSLMMTFPASGNDKSELWFLSFLSPALIIKLTNSPKKGKILRCWKLMWIFFRN